MCLENGICNMDFGNVNREPSDNSVDVVLPYFEAKPGQAWFLEEKFWTS